MLPLKLNYCYFTTRMLSYSYSNQHRYLFNWPNK